VQAINAKLVERTAKILYRLSGRSNEEVRDALAHAGGNIKIAMLLLQGCTIDQAAALLDQAGGRLRTALRLADNVPASSRETLTVAADTPSAAPNAAGEK
jgi:N-acetylmuramic acid 6-phosphate etherase